MNLENLIFSSSENRTSLSRESPGVGSSAKSSPPQGGLASVIPTPWKPRLSLPAALRAMARGETVDVGDVINPQDPEYQRYLMENDLDP